jgi:hypothetical protein
MKSLQPLCFACTCVAVACSAAPVQSQASIDGGAIADAATPSALDAGQGATPDAAVDKAARCASQFGTALTVPFGRLDGTVLAALKPTDQQCTKPNRTHVILQVKAQGQVYRMVANVLSTSNQPDVRFAEVMKPMPAPAFEEGWHTGAAISFDYEKTLNVHTRDFAPVPFQELVDRVVASITLDEEVSVYASVSGTVTDSAHLIHRNKPDADGAIILSPKSANARMLLFHFAEQMF